MRRDDERGAALVMALLALCAFSLLTAAIAFTVQGETKSSANYKYGQGAYYVANAGIQRSLAWFNSGYTPVVAAYTYASTRDALQFGGQDVVLGGQTGVTSNYPNSTMATSFTSVLGQPKTLIGDSSNATLTSGDYTSNATLLRSTAGTFLDTTTFTTGASALERWRIDAFGWWGTAANPLGTSEVSAVIERTASPFWDKAVWVRTSANFSGNPVGSYVDAYDSALGPYGGTNISNTSFGSNGDVTLGGFARINGDLFYGPTGTFNNNVQAGWTSVTGQVTQLPAKRDFPPIPNFAVGTTDPPIQKGVSTPIGAGSYRDITVPRDTNITLTGGTYYIDHFTLNQGATISLQGANTTLFVKSGLTFNQGAVLNSSDPSLFQIYYAGTNAATVSLKTTGSYYGTIYAPNATLSLSGGTGFYGSFIADTLVASGGSAIHYNKALGTKSLALGPFRIMTWTQKSY